MKIIKCHTNVCSGMCTLSVISSICQPNCIFKSIKIENVISHMLWEIILKKSRQTSLIFFPTHFKSLLFPHHPLRIPQYVLLLPFPPPFLPQQPQSDICQDTQWDPNTNLLTFLSLFLVVLSRPPLPGDPFIHLSVALGDGAFSRLSLLPSLALLPRLFSHIPCFHTTYPRLFPSETSASHLGSAHIFLSKIILSPRLQSTPPPASLKISHFILHIEALGGDTAIHRIVHVNFLCFLPSPSS